MNPQDSASVEDANASPLLEDRGEPAAAHGLTRPDFSKVKAIYFDLDDTLCAYWDASKLGLREAFEAHLPEGRTVEEMVLAWAEAFRHFAPTLKQTGWYAIYLKTAEPTRTEQMRRTLEVLGIVDDELASTLGEAYMRRRDANLALFSDAIEVLEELSARFPIGLITNGPADVQRQEIATLGIERYLSNIFIEGEMGEGKPNASVFERAAAAVNCQPDELLMVGNSYAHDVAPALAMGWHGVWIRRASDVAPSATAPEGRPVNSAEPDFVASNLREIADLLKPR